MNIVYLDYAAASPVSKRVLAAMKPFYTDVFYNPSALYSGARDAKEALEKARMSVGRSIGSRPSEIVFTAGGTESTNLAIDGVMQKHPNGELVISSVEHEAVRVPSGKYEKVECPVDSKGRVIINELKKMITDKTVLMSVMYANNEVGTVQPIKDVVKLAKEVRKTRAIAGNKTPLYVHTDACQAPLYLDINVARLGVDLMTLNGGKMHGPKQSGILYVRAGVKLEPQILGGGQEFGLRSGTENIAQAVGFATALESAVKKRGNAAKNAGILSQYFSEELKKRFDAQINGHKSLRLPNNVHVTFVGVDNERVLFSLDQQGIAAASGSACGASNDEVSHVLKSMGFSDDDAKSSLRFSIGKETTKDDIESTLAALEKAQKA